MNRLHSSFRLHGRQTLFPTAPRLHVEERAGNSIRKGVASFKPARLLPVLFFAGLLFVMDALMLNAVFLSLLAGIFQLVVGLPLLLLRQDGRRQGLRNIGILLSILVMVVVMVKVNAYIAPLHARRLIEAIESYRAATGVYPKKLDDLVPKFIDHVPWAQYTLGGIFWYTGGGTAEPPGLWYNPLRLQDQGLALFGLIGGRWLQQVSRMQTGSGGINKSSRLVAASQVPMHRPFAKVFAMPVTGSYFLPSSSFAWKKRLRISPHAAAITPEMTSTRWLSRGSASR